jgi:acyl-CoA synthetase (AMP-forming)/AMP-acid ligase II
VAQDALADSLFPDHPAFPDWKPTVPELLAAASTRFGDRECVVTPSSRLSYTELDEHSARLAASLVAAGAGKGTRVGLLFPNGTDWVIAWAAAARIGAITVPVNTFYRGPELARFLRHADVQVLLGVPQFLRHDYIAGLEAAAPELAEHGPAPLYLPSLPQLRRVALTGGRPPRWAERYAAIPDAAGQPSGPTTGPAAVVRALGEDVTPGDELLITYTSGSSGEPKGVVHSHGAVLRHAFQLGTLSGIGPDSRIWTPMPLCWVGGFVFGLLRALTAGACFLTQEVFTPGAALALLSGERVTDAAAWPAVTAALTGHPEFSRSDLSALRAGIYDGLPPDRRPPDPSLAIGALGMSETCGPHTFKTAAQEAAGGPERYKGNFGHPVPGTEHRIIDPETGRDLPDGAEGEVLVRGYSLMRGLYKREPAEVFDADGWYHTGDRGYFRDGWFFFTGRQTDLIKTRGSNVAPAEVEQRLMSYDEVRLAFVVGIPDDAAGEQVVALVVPREAGDQADGAVLRQRLRQELSSYKVPGHILTISAAQVPWLSSQKADRRSLAVLAEKLTPRADGGAPASEASPARPAAP